MSPTAQTSTLPARGPELDNRRVIAGVVDLAVVMAGALAIAFGAGLLDSKASPGLALSAVITAWALYYYFAWESGNGQTLGKKLTKIRVVRLDGGPASMDEIAVRTILRLIDGLFLYLVGLIVMLITGERRGRLGDLAARTMIVSAEAPPAPPRPVLTVEPVPAAVPITLPEPPPAPAEEELEEDELVVINPVEPVPAMELVMGEDPEGAA
jgi:uncharacterized RDD family membrane protein YckC